MQPFFSIVIPLYNKENYIENTLKSVLNQTFQDFEVIIINDGSTDKSLDIVGNFSDTRIVIIEQENMGLSEARNTGIKSSKSDFVAFLDADDLWQEDYLECINNLINLYDHTYIYATNSSLWYNDYMPDLKVEKFKKNKALLITDYFKLGKNIFSYSSIVFNKSIFNEIGRFNKDVTFGEEEEFTIKCLSVFNLAYYNESKVYYTKGVGDQLTSPNSSFHKIIPEYDEYINNENRHVLKPYIDFIHFKLVVLFKMEKNHSLVKFYKAKINVSNLTLIQKIKFYLPITLFYIIKTIYIWFSKRLVHF